MNIQYDTQAIRKKCEKASGKLRQRLNEIHAAPSMADLVQLPGKHHALRERRKGEWACCLEEPYRLVYRPLGDPLPVSEDDRLDLEKITAVTIIEVVNYHGT
jgi:toxin HigB-1